MPQMNPGPQPRLRVKWALIAALSLLVAGGAAVLYVVVGDRSTTPAKAAAERFVSAWSRGNDRAAAQSTDAPHRSFERLRSSRRGLDGATVVARVQSVHADSNRAKAPVVVRWRVPGFGPFRYTTTLPIERHGTTWRVHWAPSDIDPRLGRDARLGTETSTPDRAPILDRDGRGLIRTRPVVEIAVRAGAVKDADVTARQLVQLVGVQAGPLSSAIVHARRDQFVPVITLRLKDFLQRRAALEQIPGVSSVGRDRSLAPSRDFGHALFGDVDLATAEQLRRAHGRLTASDEVGQAGLEAAFDSRLGGAPTREIVTRDALTGEQLRTLARHRGTRPRPLRTTLDLKVQTAAEAALAGVHANAALVAVKPSSGDVLAVVNRPSDSTYDRALVGQYPPGSTFKIVSTAALVQAGLAVDTPVRCPQTLTVDGKVFRNFEGETAGQVPFSRDFAESCNTAFVSEADRLDRSALTRTASEFGLGLPVKIAVPTAPSKVPKPTSKVRQAAMMIGQDRIVATPLALAGVAATVASGRWRSPRIVSTDPHTAGRRLPAAQLSTLRTLMRAVVTSGTGSALARVPGSPAGKTGTAEYGGGDPPPTHAWFVAYRGDIAVAALVEKGRSGGTVAAPLTAKFFAALAAGR